MDAEYSIVDHSAEGEKVEHVGEVGPNVWVAVFPDALHVEAIGLPKIRTVSVGPALLTWVTALDSWLPRMSWTRSGYRSLRQVKREMVSTLKNPRST
jgi:hypothetical protein